MRSAGCRFWESESRIYVIYEVRLFIAKFKKRLCDFVIHVVLTYFDGVGRAKVIIYGIDLLTEPKSPCTIVRHQLLEEDRGQLTASSVSTQSRWKIQYWPHISASQAYCDGRGDQ